MQSPVRRVVILGAAGRDFHNFNTVFRDEPEYRVVAFTATQIPGIDGRRYPGGPRRTALPERESRSSPRRTSSGLIREREGRPLRLLVLRRLARARSCTWPRSASPPGRTSCCSRPTGRCSRSKVPVIAITAVRTGAGKSQTTRYVSRILKKLGQAGRRDPPPDAVRRPRRRRPASASPTYADLDREKCTIEEREEYEPHIDNGFVVYAGVDYGQILDARGEGGRRHPLGRRQQRPAVLRARPPHLHRRPAPRRARDRRTTRARRTSAAPTSSSSTSATRPTKAASTRSRRRPRS